MLLEIAIFVGLYFGVKETLVSNNKKKVPYKAHPNPIVTEQEEKPRLVEAPLRSDHIEAEKVLAYREKSLLSMGLLALAPFGSVFMIAGLSVYAIAIAPIFKMAKTSVIKRRTIDVQTLFFTADILRILSGSFFTAAFGLWANYAIIIYKEKVKRDYDKITTDIFKNLPDKVWLVVNDIEVEIPLEDVEVDNIISVKSGGVIPIDGVITAGYATIYEQILTGESRPIEKEVGDKVYANTIIVSGQIQVKVVNSGEDSVAAKIASIISSSSDYKSNIELKGEQWATNGILPTFILSMLMLPVYGKVIAAAVIYSHIGMRIQFLAPLGTYRHITDAVQKGILVKDGRTFENLPEIDTILFDKTGTLTTNLPSVRNIFTVGDYQKDEILRLAATAEHKLSHPIAEAILKAAEKANLALLDIDDSKYQFGHGVSVKVNDKWVRVGSDRFMTNEGVRIPEQIVKHQAEAHLKGNSIVLIGIDDAVCGAIELEAQVREEMKDILRQLRNRGINHMAIVSGDHKEPTEALAAELGFDNSYYQVLPAQKASIVEALQQEGKIVCFIGDGINDAIALKQANASISISGATTLAVDIAEIVLLDGSLVTLPEVFEISERLKNDLDRRYRLTVAAGAITLPGAIFFGFGFMSILLVQSGFFVAAIGSPLNFMKDMIALERQTIADSKKGKK